MTLIQEKEFKHYEHSLRSIIIQIQQNRLLTEKQKREIFKILKGENEVSKMQFSNVMEKRERT